MATTSNNTFGRTYNSFSGVDIKAVFGSKAMAELQAISYSVTREKAPLYTMGSADPRSFSRGKRGIAGTLVFLMFDHHALLGTFGIFQTDLASQLKFMADNDELSPVGPGGAVSSNIASSLSAEAVAIAAGENLGSTIDADYEAKAPWFVDQIPPFDVTLAAANEYGAFAVMRIYGIEILNEGYGVSIDDIVSEMQNTYVARTLVPWQSVSSAKTKELNSAAS